MGHNICLDILWKGNVDVLWCLSIGVNGTFSIYKYDSKIKQIIFLEIPNLILYVQDIRFSSIFIVSVCSVSAMKVTGSN